jgi:uncharacterized iron-regulated protein
LKKTTLLYWMISAVLIAGCAAARPVEHRLLDLKSQEDLLLSEALDRLRQSRVVLVGEHHTNADHHRAQLAVIRELHEAGVETVIGMEMFRNDSQADLDRWVNGEISIEQFERIYYDNWNYDWSLYRPIFEYARQEKIPIIGLNVPRDITRQVARQGFASLSDDQRKKLSNITCRVDQEYMEYIRRSFGAHAHGDLNFVYFCEAQLVWDNIMAVSSVTYLKSNPKSVMVLLAGAAHVRKQAVPAQIRKRVDMPTTVILPEVPGNIDSQTIDSADADYLFLGP